MKKLLLFILVASFIACKKDDNTITSDDRQLTYSVFCGDCTIVLPSSLDGQTKITGSIEKTYSVKKGFISEIELKTTRTDVTSYIFSIKVNGVQKKSVAGFITSTNGFKSNDAID